MPQDQREPTDPNPGRIYDRVRDRICLLDYPPGTQLSEPALAVEFGVSRTPVREALKRLGEEGLVESRNGVGTIVREFSLAELEDIYAMRQKVAVLIGEMRPKPVRAHHRQGLDRLFERATALRVMPDPREHCLINKELHEIVLSLIGNRALAEVFDRYFYQTSRLWFSLIDEIWDAEVDALIEEIRSLSQALACNDLVTLGYVKRNFIAMSVARVRDAIAGRGGAE